MLRMLVLVLIALAARFSLLAAVVILMMSVDFISFSVS